ncbi:MAG: glycosyltransferase [Candidatus Aenigmarchaeota archaeon]|nr:glycosyltransferase [Candidatus Aenigmarchaeota archaeon]
MSVKKVSIVIPTYNRAGDTEKAVGSVLESDYPDYEVIVVDDGSKDNTVEILKKFGNRIKVLQRKKNGGPAAARNDGINAAKGELVAFTDSDCTVSKGWITALVKFLRSLPEDAAGVCGTIYPPKDANFLMRLIYFMPQMDGNTIEAEKRKKPFEVNNISCNNALWKKKVLKEMKGFDESFFRDFRTVPEDSELCYRTLKKGHKFYMHPSAPTYHHFRPTLYEFLRQSYRAGRGGGVVFMKHKDWFGAQTPFVLGYMPALMLPVFASQFSFLWLIALAFSGYHALPAFSETKKIEYFVCASFLWLIKSAANALGFWKGVYDVVTR